MQQQIGGEKVGRAYAGLRQGSCPLRAGGLLEVFHTIYNSSAASHRQNAYTETLGAFACVVKRASVSEGL